MSNSNSRRRQQAVIEDTGIFQWTRHPAASGAKGIQRAMRAWARHLDIHAVLDDIERAVRPWLGTKPSGVKAWEELRQKDAVRLVEAIEWLRQQLADPDSSREMLAVKALRIGQMSVYFLVRPAEPLAAQARKNRANLGRNNARPVEIKIRALKHLDKVVASGSTRKMRSVDAEVAEVAGVAERTARRWRLRAQEDARNSRLRPSKRT